MTSPTIACLTEMQAVTDTTVKVSMSALMTTLLVYAPQKSIGLLLLLVFCHNQTRLISYLSVCHARFWTVATKFHRDAVCRRRFI